jgi:tryptophan synthase alpha subunit
LRLIKMTFDDFDDLVEKLAEYHAAPPLQGFGISAPEQVSAAIDAGAAGATQRDFPLPSPRRATADRCSRGHKRRSGAVNRHPRLAEYHAAPPLQGFGISAPEQVSAAIDAGAAGAISAIFRSRHPGARQQIGVAAAIRGDLAQ